MPKKLDLPLRVYEDLMKVSQELSLIAKKPISASMTVAMLMEVYRAYLSNSCALDAFSVQLQTLNLMEPQEFDKYHDEPIKEQNPKRKNKTKNKK